MWWPALGGLVVGIGGLIQPRALGVGYDIIERPARGASTSLRPWSRLIVVKAADLVDRARLGHVGRRAGARC